jgi:redox-sensitive bicupin YhaK (pirin superfamily)
VQRLSAEHVPSVSVDGATIKVYSGSFAGASSPISNHTPLIIAEITLQAGASMTSILPADFSTFVYVLAGAVQVGSDHKDLLTDEVGWLDRSESSGDSELHLKAGNYGAHFVVYAAQPQHHEIVSHGPFIADNMDEIRRLYADYRSGKMQHITEVSAERQISY